MKTNRFNNVASFERVTPEQIERARDFQSAVLCDVAGRHGALHGSIQPLVPSMVVAGPAFTVEVRPGDNLMFHVALALAQRGDVIVVDGKGYQSSALFGELMVTQAIAAKLGGLVVDGAVRDAAMLRESAMPIFANGRNPAGPTKGLDGRIGVPISLGGVSVEPGDLVIGDCDGVVVIPRLSVDKVLAAAEKKLEAEVQRLAEIRDGILVSPWLDDALRDAGVIGASETLE
jgi:4-hydroxy-4-methyl-2-oxoglutarate aldolase